MEKLTMRTDLRILAFLLLFTAGAAAAADVPRAPLTLHGYERVTTHEELLAFVDQIGRSCTIARVETIGTTTQGRAIPMVVVSSGSPAASKLRVIVFCSQHGNEPSGKEAALMLLEKIARGGLDSLLARIDLWLVPSMNPDGNELQQRWNGAGKDLNRDHVLLAQPETRALHAVYDRILPEATLDVHEFQTSGKEWDAAGYYRTMDEQWGAPTNPNVSASLMRFGTGAMFPYIEAGLRADGFRFYNYTIVGSPADTMRHSTTNINDGRQSMAIQQSFSFILEGRNGKTFHDDLERRAKGQFSAIGHFLRFVADNAATIRETVRAARATAPVAQDSVVLLAEYIFRGESLPMPVRTIASGKDSVIQVLHRSAPTPLLRTSRPLAYVVPSAQKGLLALLRRHQVAMRTLQKPERMVVEVQTVHGWTKKIFEEDETLFPAISVRKTARDFAAGDVVVPLDQLKALMVVLALEPASVWGVVQYESFAGLRVVDSEYPVYRVVRK
jgi:hypothetical protein